MKELKDAWVEHIAAPATQSFIGELQIAHRYGTRRDSVDAEDTSRTDMIMIADSVCGGLIATSRRTKIPNSHTTFRSIEVFDHLSQKNVINGMNGRMASTDHWSWEFCYGFDMSMNLAAILNFSEARPSLNTEDPEAVDKFCKVLFSKVCKPSSDSGKFLNCFPPTDYLHKGRLTAQKKKVRAFVCRLMRRIDDFGVIEINDEDKPSDIYEGNAVWGSW